MQGTVRLSERVLKSKAWCHREKRDQKSSSVEIGRNPRTQC